MPKPKKGARFGGSPAHQRLIMANLSTALFEHGRITTTEAKARHLRPIAEKLITKAKKAHLGENPLHQRREVLRTIHDKGVVHLLFTEIAPTFAERPGGYTRITKIGPRKGDNAPMAVIELVTEAYSATPRAAAPRPAAAAAPAATESDDTTEAPAEDAPTAMTEETAPDSTVAASDEPAGDGPAAEAERGRGRDRGRGRGRHREHRGRAEGLSLPVRPAEGPVTARWRGPRRPRPPRTFGGRGGAGPASLDRPVRRLADRCHLVAPIRESTGVAGPVSPLLAS